MVPALLLEQQQGAHDRVPTAPSRPQIHLRAVRHGTTGHDGRMAHSVVDHAHIVGALQTRDAGAIEERVRQHAVDLAERVRLDAST